MFLGSTNRLNGTLTNNHEHTEHRFIEQTRKKESARIFKGVKSHTQKIKITACPENSTKAETTACFTQHKRSSGRLQITLGVANGK